MRRFSNSPLVIKDEVGDALATGKAVVALESTILTHGMPYPHNLRYILLYKLNRMVFIVF